MKESSLWLQTKNSFKKSPSTVCRIQHQQQEAISKCEMLAFANFLLSNY
jgi:hypothetical protein